MTPERGNLLRGFALGAVLAGGTAAGLVQWREAPPAAAGAATPGPARLADADRDFLARFRGAILASVPAGPEALKAELRRSLDAGYADTRDLLAGRFPDLPERERFLLYLMLRVNGSFPVYEPRKDIPDDLAANLLEPRGNCADHSLRLLMILDAYGLPGRQFTFWTPSFPGHIVVDVYDPESRAAYLLDVSYDVLGRVPSAGAGFFDVVFDWTPGQREAWFAETAGNLVFAPMYVWFFDPGVLLEQNPAFDVTVEQLNADHMEPRRAKWRNTLTTELPHILEHWRAIAPDGQPQTLSQYRHRSIRAFAPGPGLPVDGLLARAGLQVPANATPLAPRPPGPPDG